MADLAVYAGLFLTAFVAATILPMQTEAALAGLILLKAQPVWLLVVVASAGNVAGSFANWLLGRGIERFRHRRWFPVGEAALQRAQNWYRRYGKWSLLLSWAPLIGDPLTFDGAFDPQAIITFLELVTSNVHSGLLRLKGIFGATDDPGRPVVAHAVQHRLYPLSRLERWPDGNHATRVVLIGRDMPQRPIRDLFDILASQAGRKVYR